MATHGGNKASLDVARDRSLDVRRARRELRKRQILAHVAQGGLVKDAIEAVGITEQTYWQWRKQDPAFRDAMMSVRSANYAEREVLNYKEFGPFRQHYLDHQSPPFHIRAVTELEKLNDGEIMLMLWPPEHGKTSLLEDFATWKICCDRKVRITVGSERKEHGEKMIGTVRRRLEGDGEFVRIPADFGIFTDGTTPWRAEAIRVTGSDIDQRDFTMRTIGIDMSAQGIRADYFFIDDIQGTNSINRTKTIVHKIRQDWFTRSGAFGKIVMVGTRVAPDDVYEELLEENLIDRLLLFPAYKITEDVWPAPDRKCFRPKSNPVNLVEAEKVSSFLWPERYNAQNYLTMRYNAGESAWARNFMQQTNAAGGGPFSESMLADASLPLVKISDPAPLNMPGICLGLDPGFGVNATLAIAMSETKMRLLNWRLDHDLENNQQILAILEGFCGEYHNASHRIDTVIIEDKAFQKGLVNDEGLKELRRRYSFRITGHQTGVNKYDPDFGVAAMARSFERGEIELPGADDPRTRAAREVLDKQLLSWRAGRKGTQLVQDLTMALWFAWMVWRRRREHVGRKDVPSWETSALPWAPTGSGLLVPGMR